MSPRGPPLPSVWLLEVLVEVEVLDELLELEFTLLVEVELLLAELVLSELELLDSTQGHWA